MLVDLGDQSTVLDERQFEFLRQQGLDSEFVPDNRMLRGYGNSIFQLLVCFSL